VRIADMQRGGRASLHLDVRRFGVRRFDLSIGVALAAAFWVLAYPVHAQDTWGGSLAITSDYVYRGLSLSRGEVAYQIGGHLRLPDQWQVGLWASTIENRDGTGEPFEANFIAAHVWTLSPDWNLRAGYTRYQYYGLPNPFNYDHDELFATVSLQSRLTLGLSFTPNLVRYQYQLYEKKGAATAIDATWSQPLLGDWSATAGVGYYDLSALYDTGYAYGHIGITGVVGPIELDVLYIDSAAEAAAIYGESTTGQRWSATARWRF
jgi:uncharacterized protein (TIGR02001 family)